MQCSAGVRKYVRQRSWASKDCHDEVVATNAEPRHQKPEQKKDLEEILAKMKQMGWSDDDATGTWTQSEGDDQ